MQAKCLVMATLCLWRMLVANVNDDEHCAFLLSFIYIFHRFDTEHTFYFYAVVKIRYIFYVAFDAALIK